MKKNQFFKKMTLAVAALVLSSTMFNLSAQTLVCEGDTYEIVVKITNATKVEAEWVVGFEGTGNVPQPQPDTDENEDEIWVWTYQTTSDDAGNTIKVNFITDYTGTYCESGDTKPYEFFVNPRPDTPTTNVTDNELFICEGETIDAIFLGNFVHGVNGHTIEYYEDDACTQLFPNTVANLTPGTYIIYAIYRNTTTNCTTYPDEALKITVTVNPRPAAPLIKSDANQSICDGETIDIDFLTALLDVAEGTTAVFYTNPACTDMYLFTTPVIANIANTPYEYYVIAKDNATGCITVASGSTMLSIDVNALPAAPTTSEEDDILSICEGEKINETFLEKYVSTGNGNDIEYYTDEFCEIPFTLGTIADLGDAPYTLYAISRNPVTGCATAAENALIITIKVNELPGTPENSEEETEEGIEICDGEEINADFLDLYISLGDYTIEYYTDKECETPFNKIDAEENGEYTIYAIARNTATGCATAISEALKITVTGINCDCIPAEIELIYQGVKRN